MSKRHATQTKRTSSPPPPSTVLLTPYEITSEPIIDGPYKRLPEDVKATLERLYSKLTSVVESCEIVYTVSCD